MATVPNRPHNVTHYAYYGNLYGTAELLNGSGYLFRQEGQRKAVVVSSRDPALLLLGHVETADTKMVEDGDRVVRCSQTLVGVNA
jgi:hypothetical protein